MQIDTHITLNEAEIFEAIRLWLKSRKFAVIDHGKEEWHIGLDIDRTQDANGTLVIKVKVKPLVK